jgi:hypothetical protein
VIITYSNSVISLNFGVDVAIICKPLKNMNNYFLSNYPIFREKIYIAVWKVLRLGQLMRRLGIT